MEIPERIQESINEKTNINPWFENKKKNGNPWYDPKVPCLSPSHNFPTHLYIPPGQSFTHICPSCGKESTASSPAIFY